METGYTLLFADNDSHTKRVLSNCFKKYFNDIFQADNGITVQKICKKNSPDVILIDIDIPETNEIEIVRKIRKIDKLIPIIVLSNNLSTKNLLEAIKLNVVDYLPKPIDFDKFNESIKLAIKSLSISKKGELLSLIKITKNSYWDKEKKLFFYKGKILELTKNERTLFDLLINKKNEIVEPRDISINVWNVKNDNLNDASIRNLVKRLRKKLPIDIVKSIYGSGYVMSF